MEKNNVIQLPIKPRKPATPKGKINFDLEQKRVVISASLVSILFFVTMANNTIIEKNLKQNTLQERGIASVDQSVDFQRKNNWEKEMAENLLAETPADNRAPASIGSQASREDQLKYGFFEGYYAFKMNGGKIKEISSQSNRDTDKLKLLNNPRQFILNNRELLAVNFETVQTISRNDSNGHIIETYALLSSENTTVGHITLELDDSGRMHSMKVE